MHHWLHNRPNICPVSEIFLSGLIFIYCSFRLLFSVSWGKKDFQAHLNLREAAMNRMAWIEPKEKFWLVEKRRSEELFEWESLEVGSDGSPAKGSGAVAPGSPLENFFFYFGSVRAECYTLVLSLRRCRGPKRKPEAWFSSKMSFFYSDSCCEMGILFGWWKSSLWWRSSD